MTTDRRDLSKLASQLHSEHDRQHYAKVISIAENLQARIQELQKLKASCTSNNKGRSADDKQPLERYYRLLERSQSIQKQLTRLSAEYSLPPHPPPSFPPPSLPPPPPPPKNTLTAHHNRLPTTPPPTPKKNNDDSPITPPASPRIYTKQVRFEEKNNDEPIDEPPLPPLPQPSRLPPITHVQKRINGLRGFLTRTYQLSNDLVMSRAHITPLRLFTATELLTGQPKAVLKIVITAHHDYGFSFYWPSSPIESSSNKPNRANDIAKFAVVPDSLVQDALDSWIGQQGGVLPPLHQATHILRESIKIYVVYNRYHFNL
ncbi:hypothetical protein BJV82DRAFT_714581 [Fennellomyces sp. T-0311]|nr:hypothetical protein BJV82DRAFT_714581 [Fennellomyces sp. T-0311]